MKDKRKIIKNISEANNKTLHILETKLFGKAKLPKGETVLSLLGRK
jgi:hypothetical protein